MDRRHGGACIVVDAAGDDRHHDVLGFEPLHQVADIERDFDHHQVRALAGAHDRHRLVEILGVSDGSALVHRHFGGEGELASESADDQETHGLIPSN